MTKEAFLKIFDRKVMLRGALYGFLFALGVGLFVYSAKFFDSVSYGSSLYSIARLYSVFAVLLLVFLLPPVAVFIGYIPPVVGVVLYFVFWILFGVLMAILLNKRSRMQKIGLWILMILLYAVFTFNMYQFVRSRYYETNSFFFPLLD